MIPCLSPRAVFGFPGGVYIIEHLFDNGKLGCCMKLTGEYERNGEFRETNRKSDLSDKETGSVFGWRK